MPALKDFLTTELLRRDWTIAEFAKHAGLSTSNAYVILRDGNDNVQQRTFEAIAAALSMTPAELQTAIGQGQWTPDEVRLVATYREIPAEKRSWLQEIANGMRTATTAKSHKRPSANRAQPPQPKVKRGGRDKPRGDANPPITFRKHALDFGSSISRRPSLAGTVG